jgi:peroxiredoxin Q/BCP
MSHIPTHIFVLALAALVFADTASALDVGDAVPDFVLQGSDGKQYGRDELVAGGGAVIAWFPRAFTPG